jgi:ribosomal protein L39E
MYFMFSLLGPILFIIRIGYLFFNHSIHMDEIRNLLMKKNTIKPCTIIIKQEKKTRYDPTRRRRRRRKKIYTKEEIPDTYKQSKIYEYVRENECSTQCSFQTSLFPCDKILLLNAFDHQDERCIYLEVFKNCQLVKSSILYQPWITSREEAEKILQDEAKYYDK